MFVFGMLLSNPDMSRLAKCVSTSKIAAGVAVMIAGDPARLWLP